LQQTELQSTVSLWCKSTSSFSLFSCSQSF